MADIVGGPAGSRSEPEDLPEATELPHAPLGSFWAGCARLQLVEEATHLGNSLHSAPSYPILHDFSPLKQALGSKEAKILCPLQDHTPSSLQTLLQPGMASLLPAPQSPALPTLHTSFVVMPASRPSSSELHGSAPLPSYSKGHCPFCSQLRYKPLHGRNQVPPPLFLNLLLQCWVIQKVSPPNTH